MSNQASRILFRQDTEAQLPASALACKYIESTMDSQYINTGIFVAQKLQILLRGQFASYNGNENWLFGYWNNWYGTPYDARSYMQMKRKAGQMEIPVSSYVSDDWSNMSDEEFMKAIEQFDESQISIAWKDLKSTSTVKVGQMSITLVQEKQPSSEVTNFI